MKKLLLIVSLLIFISSCFLFKQVEQFSSDLQEIDDDWVISTLNSMSLNQKIGQMIMPFARYESGFGEKNRLPRYKMLVRKYQVGGFVIRSKDVFVTLKNNQGSTMFNEQEIYSTIKMLKSENLDVRTVTLGINLLDCVSHDLETLKSNIKEKITHK